ncbi:hypothetical protein [Knoellia subterranea]|nr:hypothetical protein [Knoellia subterranea]
MSDPILELLAAPPSPSMSVDENAVYAGGRRRVRRRALRRTGFGLGAAAAAAAIAFAVVGPGVGGDALPADRPSQMEGAGKAVSANLFDGTYAVEVIPGAPADQPNVKFYKVDGGKRSLLAGSSADANVVSMGTGSGADGIMLGTAPATLAKSLTIAPGSKGGIQQDEALLPGTDYKAYALKFDNPADVETYQGTIWMDDTDSAVVRDAMGNRLASTKIGATDTFFVHRDADVMGVFTADGGSTKQLGTSSITTLGTGQRHEGEDWSWLSITLLPEGSRNVTFEWADAATHHDAVVTDSSGTDGAVAWATGTAPGDGPGPRVTRVTWTDKAGTRHTEAAN